MSSTEQLSLPDEKQIQLAEINERYPELPKGQSPLVKAILFGAMEELLGVTPKTYPNFPLTRKVVKK